MENEQQFEQLMLQYEQLKNGAEDIMRLMEEEDFDGAITMTKSRESVFLNCKCMQRYLELTPEQKKQADEIIEEIKKLEKRNIDYLLKNMEKINLELKKTQKTEKIQMAYDFDEDQKGSIVNIQE